LAELDAASARRAGDKKLKVTLILSV